MGKLDELMKTAGSQFAGRDGGLNGGRKFEQC